MQGKIIKALAGFYYVYVVGSGIYKCRARGLFRLQGIKPLVGDDVEIEVTDPNDMEGNVNEIHERRNSLERPAAANVDQAVILFAMTHPSPNTGLIDRFIIMAESEGIPCILAANKADTASEEEVRALMEAYSMCGHPFFAISVKEGTGMDGLMDALNGKTTLLAGPSGVGKSSLTNYVCGRSHMETGEISKKLARGKNTTRHVELVAGDDGTYICDTPGFSALTAAGIESQDLRFYYSEFEPYEGKCRFDGCVHISEPDCAVREAVAAGAFPAVRHENYMSIFSELREAERRRYK